MESWKRGIWATSGAVLVAVALAAAGTWYVATATAGRIGGVRILNPLVVVCGIIALIGMYMCAAALCDWPLPGRRQELQNRAEQDKLEMLKRERAERINDQLVRLIADAEAVEGSLLQSSQDPPDESWFDRWTNDARTCVSKIDVKLLPAFDQQRPPAEFHIEGRSPQLAQIIGLLKVRSAFLARLKSRR